MCPLKLLGSGFPSLNPCSPRMKALGPVVAGNGCHPHFGLLGPLFFRSPLPSGTSGDRQSLSTLSSPEVACLALLSLFCEWSCSISITVQRSSPVTGTCLPFPGAPHCLTHVLTQIAQCAGPLPSSPSCLTSSEQLYPSGQFTGCYDNR